VEYSAKHSWLSSSSIASADGGAVLLGMAEL
jgi:hypothetical protein